MSNFWGLFFHVFMGKNLFFLNFFYIVPYWKVAWYNSEQNLGSILGGLKIAFFRASCCGFIVKGVCPLLLSLVSLVFVHYVEIDVHEINKQFFWVGHFDIILGVNVWCRHHRIKLPSGPCLGSQITENSRLCTTFYHTYQNFAIGNQDLLQHYHPHDNQLMHEGLTGLSDFWNSVIEQLYSILNLVS